MYPWVQIFTLVKHVSEDVISFVLMLNLLLSTSDGSTSDSVKVG